MGSLDELPSAGQAWAHRLLPATGQEQTGETDDRSAQHSTDRRSQGPAQG